MSVKFGDRLEVIASPALVLRLEAMLSDWVMGLSTQEEIDLEREAMSMAQRIVGALVDNDDSPDAA